MISTWPGVSQDIFPVPSQSSIYRGYDFYLGDEAIAQRRIESLNPLSTEVMIST